MLKPMVPLWHSVRFRVLLLMLAFMAGLYFWMQHNVADILSHVAVAHTQSSIKLTSEALNIAITPHTTHDGLRGLSDYFRELLSDDDSGLVYLSLYDDYGVLLATTQKESNSDIKTEKPLASQVQEGLVHVVQPILILENRVGELHYGLSTVAFRDSVSRIEQENLSVLLIAVVVFAALLVFFGVQFNQRLMRLMRASKALAQGNYQERAPEVGQDEISLLAANFNAMAQAVADRVAALEASQQQINELNMALESRVSQRTWELEDALDTLHETQSNLIQSEKLASLGALVAGVSHELNTPIGNALTVVTTCAEKNAVFSAQLARGALRKSQLESYVQDMKEAEVLASRNLQRAANLIQSFKQVAIDQTSYQRRRFDLAVTIDEILLTIQPTLRQSQVEVTSVLSPGLMLDSFPGPLGQIMTNLINNALIHAFEGVLTSDKKITISALTEDNQWLVLTVSDNGRGISGENLGKVFDPFFTTRLGQGGSGLGLHIVHNLVIGILGGQIRVFSGEGRGAQFVIRLPLVAPKLSDGVQ